MFYLMQFCFVCKAEIWVDEQLRVSIKQINDTPAFKKKAVILPERHVFLFNNSFHYACWFTCLLFQHLRIPSLGHTAFSLSLPPSLAIFSPPLCLTLPPLSSSPPPSPPSSHTHAQTNYGLFAILSDLTALWPNFEKRCWPQAELLVAQTPSHLQSSPMTSSFTDDLALLGILRVCVCVFEYAWVHQRECWCWLWCVVWRKTFFLKDLHAHTASLCTNALPYMIAIILYLLSLTPATFEAEVVTLRWVWLYAKQTLCFHSARLQRPS